MNEENIVNDGEVDAVEDIIVSEKAENDDIEIFAENDCDEREQEDVCEDIVVSEEEKTSEYSAEDFAKILQNPMFAVFARGRKGEINDIMRDFSAMMEAGSGLLSQDARMRFTPGAGSCSGGIALSERQKRIARSAGMSYREYYDLISTLPAKK